MKRLIAIILTIILTFTLFACGGKDYVRPVVDSTPTPEVSEVPVSDNNGQKEAESTAETDAFVITLPDIVRENCEFTVSDNTIVFTMKDGGDYVCEFICCAASDYSDEFWVYKVADNGPEIVYMAFPTCGTLNNEGIRELLEEVTEALKTAPVAFK